MRYPAYTTMIQEITFLEFLEVILSFMPYILLEIFLVFVGWFFIIYLQFKNTKNRIVPYSIDEILK